LKSSRATHTSVAPLALAVAAFGASFGVLAEAAHTPTWVVLACSAVVFAGSSQFAALGALTAGAGAIAAIATGVLLNLRFLATGTATAPALPGGKLRRFLLSQLIVDESYAIGVAEGRGRGVEGRAAWVSGVIIWTAWVGGTVVGVLVGPALGSPERLGLDAAFPALYVGLLLPMLRLPGGVRAAVAGLVVAVLLTPFTPPGVPLAGAALAGLVAAR
jgi:predicted branched-subunit amino acid permease